MDSEKQGYLGNLEDKSIQELQELLNRQENILKKKKFVSSLPDKGKKILDFREQLVDLITRKQNVYSEETVLQSSTSTTEKIIRRKNPQIKPKSRFSEVDSVTKSVKTVHVEKNVVRDIVTMDTQQTEEFHESRVMQDNSDTIPSAILHDTSDIITSRTQNTASTTNGSGDFAMLRDKSNHSESRIHEGSTPPTHSLNTRNEKIQQKPKTHDKDVNMLEKALEQMEIDPAVSTFGSEELRNKILQNSTKIDPHFKANSFLKIHHVQDLPDKYKWKSRADHPIAEQETLGQHHSAIVEESAATPPNYKYSEARLIPLEESMQIQQTQQRHQEELQAKAAAERLAKSLKIKMESYNPEGRNIVYRSQPESFHSDSDDEPEVEFCPDDVD